uniref:Uncharacterized protein n=1 Tax=Moniliophthora roreri TaxID=221103 RepID=A0A0W0FD81_MONRR
MISVLDFGQSGKRTLATTEVERRKLLESDPWSDKSKLTPQCRLQRL